MHGSALVLANAFPLLSAFLMVLILFARPAAFLILLPVVCLSRLRPALVAIPRSSALRVCLKGRPMLLRLCSIWAATPAIEANTSAPPLLSAMLSLALFISAATFVATLFVLTMASFAVAALIPWDKSSTCWLVTVPVSPLVALAIGHM